ncbi:hypothetical protein KHA94_16345 [Bacillus sp. FJAT-49705]|uniref:Uncharacterized protein n=1 Tax=Cytobacillus citreus TaxID=2833586 RepID=A0ABS5NV98_9BACI|nr:hypothetical protein [Cytobacillus citreus]MBS4191761.1 hypothetical protein [Cytobacillus citreus]
MIDYEKLQKTIAALREALEPVVKNICEAWSVLKSIASSQDEYLKKKKQIDNMHSSWNAPKDTRIKSQVINRKPKHTVRKIIR